MGAIGEDEYGAFIINECRSLGVPTSGLISKTNFATAHTHVMSVGGQSRTFFYQGGANDTLTINDFPEGTFKSTSARIFYLGYLTLLRDLDQLIEDNLTNAAKVLKRAQNAGLVTCVDLVSIHHPEFSRIVGRAAPFVDFLISNEIEAAQATDTKVGPESLTSVKTLVQMAHRILDLGVRNAVIIHCVERVVWVGSDRNVFTIEIEALRADEIASNLGAGDAFCAGLLYGIHESRGPERAVQLGNAVAQASLKGLTATSAISAAAIKSLR